MTCGYGGVQGVAVGVDLDVPDRGHDRVVEGEGVVGGAGDGFLGGGSGQGYGLGLGGLVGQVLGYGLYWVHIDIFL